MQTETKMTAQQALSAIQQQLDVGLKVTGATGKTESAHLGLAAGSVSLDHGVDATKADATGTKSASVDIHGKTGVVRVGTGEKGFQMDASHIGLKAQSSDSQGAMSRTAMDGGTASVGSEASLSGQTAGSSAILEGIGINEARLFGTDGHVHAGHSGISDQVIMPKASSLSAQSSAGQEVIGIFALDGGTADIGPEAPSTAQDHASSMTLEGIGVNPGRFLGADGQVHSGQSSTGGQVKVPQTSSLHSQSSVGQEVMGIFTLDGGTANIGPEASSTAQDHASSMTLEGIGINTGSLFGTDAQSGISDQAQMPLAASSSLHPESGILKAVGVDITSALAGGVGSGAITMQGNEVDTAAGIVDTEMSSGGSSKFVSGVSQLETSAGVEAGLSSWPRDIPSSGTVQMDSLPSFSDKVQTGSDLTASSVDTFMPVEGIAAFSSGQNIPVDIQALKNVDMSGIFSKLNSFADQGQTPPGSPSLGQPVSDVISHGDTKKTETAVFDGVSHGQEAAKGVAHAEDFVHAAGSANSRMLEPIASGHSKTRDTLGFSSDRSKTLQAAKGLDTGVLFTGKTITGHDPTLETTVEKGLARADVSEAITGVNANDVGLLSGHQQFDITNQMHLKPKEPSQSSGFHLPDLKSQERRKIENVGTSGFDKITDLSHLGRADTFGTHLSKKNTLPDIGVDPSDIPLADPALIASVETHPQAIKSDPSQPADELQEINHHNKTTKTEKTIQQVTTKNTSLPDGSNVVETKLKTVEVKVTETTKVSSEKNGVSTTSETKNLVGKSELKPAPEDLVSGQKASVIDKHKKEAVNINEVGPVSAGADIKSDQVLSAVDLHQPDSILAGETIHADKAVGGFDSVVQMALNGIMQDSQTSGEQSIGTADILEPSSIAADSTSDFAAKSASGLSAVSKGLAHLAKMNKKSKKSRSRKGKPDVNITSKKAKINISHGNTKRTVSEIDISKAKPEKTQPDVAFIIVNGDGQSPALTLKGLAQSLDPVNQHEVLGTGAEQVLSKSDAVGQLDLQSLADTKAPVADKAKTRRKKKMSKKRTNGDTAKAKGKKKKSKKQAAVDGGSKISGKRGIISEASSAQKRSQGKQSKTSTRRRDKVVAADLPEGNIINQITDTRRRPSVGSETPRRATSFIGDPSPTTTRGTQRRDRTRQMSGRSDSRMPTFSSGLTRGMRIGPSSGTLTPEMRVEFERRRILQRRRGAIDRMRLSDRARRQRRLDGRRIGRRIITDPVSRPFYPFDRFLGDRRMLRSGATSRFPISGPGADRFRAGRRTMIRGFDMPVPGLDPRIAAVSRREMERGRRLLGVRGGIARAGVGTDRGFIDTRVGRRVLSGGGARTAAVGGVDRIPGRPGIQDIRADRRMGFQSIFGRGRTGSRGMTAAATITSSETSEGVTARRSTSTNPEGDPSAREPAGSRAEGSASGLASRIGTRSDVSAGALESQTGSQDSGRAAGSRRRSRQRSGARTAASEVATGSRGRGAVTGLDRRSRDRLAAGIGAPIVRIGGTRGAGGRRRDTGFISTSRRDSEARRRRVGGGSESRSRGSATTARGGMRSSRAGGIPSSHAGGTSGTGAAGRIRLGRLSAGEFVRSPLRTVRYSSLPFSSGRRFVPSGGRYVVPPAPYPSMGMPGPMYVSSGGPMFTGPGGSGFMGSFSGYPYTPMGPFL